LHLLAAPLQLVQVLLDLVGLGLGVVAGLLVALDGLLQRVDALLVVGGQVADQLGLVDEELRVLLDEDGQRGVQAAAGVAGDRQLLHLLAGLVHLVLGLVRALLGLLRVVEDAFHVAQLAVVLLAQRVGAVLQLGEALTGGRRGRRGKRGQRRGQHQRRGGGASGTDAPRRAGLGGTGRVGCPEVGEGVVAAHSVGLHGNVFSSDRPRSAGTLQKPLSPTGYGVPRAGASSVRGGGLGRGAAGAAAQAPGPHARKVKGSSSGSPMHGRYVADLTPVSSGNVRWPCGECGYVGPWTTSLTAPSPPAPRSAVVGSVRSGTVRPAASVPCRSSTDHPLTSVLPGPAA